MAVAPPANAGVGTVTIARTLVVSAPTIGTSANIATYTANLIVGSTFYNTTPPANGAIIEGNVGIGGSTNVNNKLEVVGGGLRVQSTNSTTATGSGIELEYSGGEGYVRAFNRAGASFTPLWLSASNIRMGSLTTFYVGLTLPTTGGTASTLDYYEELSQTFTFAGVWAANQSVTGKLIRIGRIVNLILPSVYAATNASANILQTVGTAFPARFRPLVTTSFIVRIADNSTFNPALMYARSDGLIQAYSNANGSPFAATGSAGWDLLSITWNIS